MSRSGITTVVVSMGLDRMLHVCLGALGRALALRAGGAPDLTVIVDNASPQPYPARLGEQHGAALLRFDTPASFAQACNDGYRAYPNDLVLLLNNDVILEPDAVQAMVGVLDAEPDVGICGLRLLFPDATLQHGGVVFGAGDVGPYHWARRMPEDAVPRVNRPFQAVTGACALIRGELWHALGGLDTSYPFGLEDVDFCLRALAMGARIACCHEADGLHFESMTPGRVEKDKPSRRLFMQRWRGRYAIDG